MDAATNCLDNNKVKESSASSKILFCNGIFLVSLLSILPRHVHLEIVIGVFSTYNLHWARHTSRETGIGMTYVDP